MMVPSHKSWTCVVSLVSAALGVGPPVGQTLIEQEGAAGGATGFSDRVVQLPPGRHAAADPMIHDRTFSSWREADGWLRGFVGMEPGVEFQDSVAEPNIVVREEGGPRTHRDTGKPLAGEPLPAGWDEDCVEARF